MMTYYPMVFFTRFGFDSFILKVWICEHVSVPSIDRCNYSAPQLRASLLDDHLNLI